MILYYFPVFFVSDVPDRIKELLVCLSIFIHLLFKSRVDANDIASAKTLLDRFRSLAIESFGESVQTMTFHALVHLPDQVNVFGPLWTTSAMFLKRFLIQKMITKRVDERINCLNVIGRTCQLGDYGDDINVLQQQYSFTFNEGDCFAYRFVANKTVFHAFSYARKLSSASYFAALYSNVFVRIDHIVVRENDVFCLCTELYKLMSAPEVLTDVPEETRCSLIENSVTYCVRFGREVVFPAFSLKSHWVLVLSGESVYATPVSQTFEIN